MLHEFMQLPSLWASAAIGSSHSSWGGMPEPALGPPAYK